MLIDPSIRDKVLLPLMVFVVVFSLSRNYLFKLIMPKPADVIDKEELRQKNLVSRSARLRANMGYISSAGAAMRKNWLMDENEGKLRGEAPDPPPPNPMAGFDQMKLQLVNQGVWMGIFAAIQSVLAGFIIVKIPFALTERFKQLTQQGIGLASLDTSFVSSGSWYMIAQNGLQRLLELTTSGAVISEAQLMQMQMMGPMGGAPGQAAWAPKVAYAGERGALQTTRFRSVLVSSEAELLAAARALPDYRPQAAAGR